MKKIISAAIIAVTATFGAVADTFDGSMLYGYSTSPAGALEFKETTEAGMAFLFSESDIKYFTGCRITAIAVANGAPAAGSKATEQAVRLFTASGFNSMGIADETLTYDGTMDLTAPGQYKEYPLPEPIEITEGMEPIWFGVTAVCDPKVAGVLMFDSWSHDASIQGGMVGAIDQEGDPMIWTNLSGMYGFGCIRVKVEGRGFPANEVSMLDCMIPDFVNTSTAEPIYFYALNEAGNDINSLTVSYTIGNSEMKTKTYEFENPIVYNNYVGLQLDVEIPAQEQNNLRIAIDITEINGVKNTAKENARSRESYCLAMAAGNGFMRNMVAEVATGTWCGYCPIGIVGVSKMLADHPDGTFIPIAVHVSDQMTTTSYNLFQTNFTGDNAPVLVVNRNAERYGMKNPSYEIMSQMYPAVRATPAMAELTIDGIEIDSAGKKVNVNVSTDFAFDFTDGNYAVAFVLTEDHVGPYAQNNYYGAEGAPLLEEWNSLPEAVMTEFNCVARQINLYNGVNGTVPAEVKAGESYAATAALRTNTVSNIQNCNIIAMLINRTTGRIENAVMKSVAELPVREIEADLNDSPAEIYDLQGRRLSHPVKGQIYIQGGRKFVN